MDARRHGIVEVEPGRETLRIVNTRPASPACCSNCVPLDVIEQAVLRFANRAIPYGWESLYAVSLAEDGSAKYLYRAGDGEEARKLLRHDSNGEVTILMTETEAPIFGGTAIGEVALSPSARLVAYILHTGGSSAVKVYRLDTGDLVTMSSYVFVGNLMWAPDADRLYYAWQSSPEPNQGILEVDFTH